MKYIVERGNCSGNVFGGIGGKYVLPNPYYYVLLSHLLVTRLGWLIMLCYIYPCPISIPFYNYEI